MIWRFLYFLSKFRWHIKICANNKQFTDETFGTVYIWFSYIMFLLHFLATNFIIENIRSEWRYCFLYYTKAIKDYPTLRAENVFRDRKTSSIPDRPKSYAQLSFPWV